MDATDTHFDRESGLPLMFGVGDGVDDFDSFPFAGAVAIEFADFVGVSISTLGFRAFSASSHRRR